MNEIQAFKVFSACLERCCRASLAATGLPASQRPFPGGCPRLDTWKFTHKRGGIQLLPHPWYCLPAQRLHWWQVLSYPAQRSCGIAWQDSRTASKDSTGIPKGNIRSIAAAPSAIGQRGCVQAQQLRTWHLSTKLKMPAPKGMVGWKGRVVQGMNKWTDIFGCTGRTAGDPAWCLHIPCEHPSPRLGPE